MSEHTRNFSLIGHSGAGKTALSEAMLFDMGVVNRIGRISDGTTTSDYDSGEIERGRSRSGEMERDRAR